MIRYYVTIVAATVLLSGCATTETSDQLNNLSNRLNQLEQDQTVQKHAAVELEEAKEKISEAESVWNEEGSGQQFEHQAYLADRYLSITDKTAELGAIEQNLAQAENRRSELLLSIRKQEAEQARAQAQQNQEKLQSLQNELQNAKAKDTDRGIVLTLEDVLFGFDKAQLKPGGERTVQRLAEFLRDYPDTSVTIEGYTDAVGSDDYNMKLSRDRAEAVKEQLRRLNVARDRINVRAFGESYPVASNDTSAGRQQNRRVEVVLSGEDKQYQSPQRSQQQSTQ